MQKTIEVGGTAGQPLMADIYLPEIGSGAPLVVAISGGGWSRGHRAVLAPWARHLVANGIAVASIDYRRVNGGPAWPGNAEDVRDAIAGLAARAEEHGYDAERIAVLGISAGAHLGALAVLRPSDAMPKIRAFAGIYGVYDLMAHWQADAACNSGRGTDKTEAMLGCAPFADPQRYHDASPLRQITYERALPVFLCWGHLDRDIAPSQSANFAHALKQAGYPVTCVEFSEAPHLWFSEERPDEAGSFSARLAPSLVRFFKRVLDIKP